MPDPFVFQASESSRHPSRRAFLQAAAATQPAAAAPVDPIDRRALVGRHNVRRTKSSRRSPLQVGNGTIALGADITGLQTFVPFNIMSQWGWHYAPLPPGVSVDQMQDVTWQGRDRGIPYDTGDPAHPAATAWIFANPSRINLGRIGLILKNGQNQVARESELTEAAQELDLWTGTLRSTFKLDGQTVVVSTACHPDQDTFAVKIESTAVAAGNVGVFIDFPIPDDRQFADAVGTYANASRYPMETIHRSADRIDLHRRMAQDQFSVSVVVGNGVTLRQRGEAGEPQPVVKITRARYGADLTAADVKGTGTGWTDVTAIVTQQLQQGTAEIVAGNDLFNGDPALKHVKRLEVNYTVDGVPHSDAVHENGRWTPQLGTPYRLHLTGSGNVLSFVTAFAPGAIADRLPTVDETMAAAARSWPEFWASGGAIDLSRSADPRWRELERRIVLSQYLLACNEAGSLPPQESGLVNNGWFGKFHMEMYWWHAAHYALWNRWKELDRSLDIYNRMLPEATARAKKQGFKGARWTKMTGPDFRNSAFITNVLLVWQQPHCMFFAELDYRAHPTQATLDKWKPVIFAAADFMASFATYEPAAKRYDLGPPMAVVSENTDDKITTNPTFELCYWRFGLRIAQTWRQRLQMPADPDWDQVLTHLAPLPVQDGLYVTYEGVTDMWTKHNAGHPALTGIFGWLPGDGVDRKVMADTLEKVLGGWQWHNDVWGWDFPMMAMCAARLGLPEKAIDLLLTPGDNFGFDDAGLATGGPYPYFPSNGGLLYAMALLCAGWDAGPDRHAPGFPDNGQWTVRYEGLSKAI